MLSQIGWYFTFTSLAMFLLVLVLSLFWHWIDGKADACLTIAKEFWSKGNKVDGGIWHDETNKHLALGYKIKAVGMFLLYAAAFIGLFGGLFLLVGSRQ